MKLEVKALAKRLNDEPDNQGASRMMHFRCFGSLVGSQAMIMTVIRSSWSCQWRLHQLLAFILEVQCSVKQLIHRLTWRKKAIPRS